MLRFNEDSLFFKDYAELIRQFKQTEQMLEKREKAKPAVAAPSPNKKAKIKITDKEKKEITKNVRANLMAQVSSLFKHALAKEGEHYKYLDFLVENYETFEKVLTPSADEDDPPKEKLEAKVYIEQIKNYFIRNQRDIFDIVLMRSLTKQDLLACGPYVNSLYASAHDANKKLFKYDSLLHYAARLGDAESVRVLLAAGAKVDGYKPDYEYKDKKHLTINTTALGVAIASDNTSVARVLLEAGASIDIDEFRSATNKNPITDNIQSEDMRALLIEFSLARMRDNPFNAKYTFTQQVLIAANHQLKDELDNLHRKVDKLVGLVEKRARSASYKGPGLFDDSQYQPEDLAHEHKSPHKRNKGNDVD